jgi:hypothetical protein
MESKMKSQRGFTIVEGLLVVIALTLIGGVGFYIYHTNQDKKDNSAQTPTQSANKVIEKDPTEGWKTYKDGGGLFEFKYPGSWSLAHNLEACGSGLVLLGANQESTGACASDGTPQIMIEAKKGDLLRSDYELRESDYKDIKSESLSVNGVAGLKQTGTFNPKEEVFIGPVDGDKKLIYIFQDEGYTYAATYFIRRDNPFPDVQTDFETLVTKTLKFK